ncbi:D-2-hydroxyacid dehydrogenase [Brachyspira hampsonii]|uniref:D-isomer specific 2-hydroxyacid dehydrogenase catalytic domain-containing protein n=1 Tax=Brachyspira hampsonii 30446 TaxID=1289135 RepID=A0A2U4FRE0_9SPIR|nr:D-2-hydroxyacid dehydrogenase [Brachyspira hampsonii]EKV57813.1 D-isomer specific 2-hydroxyacid dehydrogenase catalytic domain-containing protein [Brachyspira hampsonii 30446]MBW5390811.1 D-2-hydroxyacid dehydrogenase [Brachyspira hampsonii]MBW5395109.1 D-2-hydroxyacid dehydrogenase [Brachyspira hampsonii]OEJ20465.1 glycerate dehydrogenase [Brachyspira hampsonii]
MNKPKIVVLDGAILNPGDISWGEIESISDLTVYDRTDYDKVPEVAKDAWGILNSKVVIDRKLMKSLPNLKYVGMLATGYDSVDIEAAKELGITVTNVRGYGPQSVAQLVMAFVLSLSFRIVEHNNQVHNGDWVKCKAYSFSSYPLMEIENKTMGIFGFGDIGKEVAKMASAMGMKVLVYSRSKKENVENASSIDELFERSDFLSLNAPLNKETENIVNKDLLSKMKKTAFLINTSRGGVIVEKDLAYSLNNDIIAGAALDVLSKEPPTADNPLLTAKNCYITPHFAGNTLEARTRLMHKVYENIKAFLEGNPINVLTK